VAPLDRHLAGLLLAQPGDPRLVMRGGEPVDCVILEDSVSLQHKILHLDAFADPNRRLIPSRKHPDKIAALVVGAPAEWPREDAPDPSADQLILRCVPGGFPVITNVGFGHQPLKIQFPLGCRVEFEFGGDRPVLRYLEDFVTS
jgi:hypothetical protein